MRPRGYTAGVRAWGNDETCDGFLIVEISKQIKFRGIAEKNSPAQRAGIGDARAMSSADFKNGITDEINRF